MWWFINFMNSWVYAIMVIDMVLFWVLIVLGLIGLFCYLASGDRSTSFQDKPEHGFGRAVRSWRDRRAAVSPASRRPAWHTQPRVKHGGRLS